MAIEEFGESLLSDKRKRAEKQAKREKRETLILGAAKIGLDLYGDSLKKKAEKFASNQELWSNRVKYNNTLGVAQTLLKDTEPMDTYIGGERGWVLDNLANPLITKQLAKLVPVEEYGEKSLGSFTDIEAERVVDGYTDEQGNKVEGILAKLQKARSAARNLKSIENYDAMVELNNNNPKSIAEAVMNRFKGKDADSLQQEAINNIKNNKFSTDAEAANVLMQAFYNGASVKDSENLAERFQQAIKEGRISSLSDKLINTQQVQLPTAVGGVTVLGIIKTYQKPDGSQYSVTTRVSETGKEPVNTQIRQEETTVTDIFGQTSTVKGMVVRNLDTGEAVQAVQDTKTKPTNRGWDKILLNVPSNVAENIRVTVGTVSSNIPVTENKTGNDIITEYANNGDNPENIKKLVENSVINLTANLVATTNERIDFSTASNIATAVAVSEAKRALSEDSFFKSVNRDIQKASPQAGFDTPNFITIIEGMALLQGTSNAVPANKVEEIITELFEAHINTDVSHPYEKKIANKMVADFFNVDPNIRQEILTSNKFVTFTKNMPIKIDNKEISLYSFLIDTHKKVMKKEIDIGVLKETNAVLNYLGWPSLEELNAEGGRLRVQLRKEKEEARRKKAGL
jgi:hypothetical protein